MKCKIKEEQLKTNTLTLNVIKTEKETHTADKTVIKRVQSRDQEASKSDKWHITVIQVTVNLSNTTGISLPTYGLYHTCKFYNHAAYPKWIHTHQVTLKAIKLTLVVSFADIIFTRK